MSCLVLGVDRQLKDELVFGVEERETDNQVTAGGCGEVVRSVTFSYRSRSECWSAEGWSRTAGNGLELGRG